MEHSEQLQSMLQDIINGREEQARVTMHNYFINKTKEVSGLGQEETVPEENDEDDSDD